MAKSETDHCYNQCASIIIDSLSESIRSGNPGLGVLFGTHNEESADRIIETLASKRLGRSVSEKGLVVGSQLADRVAFAQLYGI
jgi:proline dehydrogenase